MRILLVYPRYPDTFWSFKHALKFVSKRAAFPPLGILTVAAMLPDNWEKKLVDLNITRLTDEDIEWADFVFISAMQVQRASVIEVVERCRKLNTITVAGGPLFTTGYMEFEGIDHFVLGEAETTLKPFLDDLKQGKAKHLYTSMERPDITSTPIPMWSLLDMSQYSSMNLQYSRGCPYDCEFCDIVVLNGHTPRTKSKEQLIAEMDALYDHGWRGSLFIVDDNFIGNKKKLKAEILPALIEWRKSKKYPFVLYTEVSINLADDDELIRLMVDAGFDVVFIGIETPDEKSLQECNKGQNQNRDLVASVNKLQASGLEVQGGFIIGFDNDTESIFQDQINFIQKSGIVTAMVGLLNAPLGTKLHDRLEKEGRLLSTFTGNNTDSSLNFVPRMDTDKLIEGYRRVIHTIYDHEHYYERIKTFMKVYNPPRAQAGKVQSHHFKAFFRSIFYNGITGGGRRYYWKLFFKYLFTSLPRFARFIVLSVYGHHFYVVAQTEEW